MGAELIYGDTGRVQARQIVFVTREGDDLPGARIRCYAFAKELARRGMRTSVLSFADTLGAKSGAREHEMGWPRRLWLNLRAFQWLARLDDGTVLVLSRCHYHVLAPILQHLWRGRPFILDLDDWEMREEPAYRWGWYPTSKAHWLTRWLAQRSLTCLAASRALYELLAPWQTVHYVPTAVDTDRFAPQPMRRAPHETVFSWIGTFHHREYVDNVAFLLNCFAQVERHLPDARLEIVGDGLHRDAIRSAIQAAGSSRVRWRGWLAPRDMPAYLETIDVGCYPVARATRFHLAKSPTKVFEYMAMGKAVVASDVGEAGRILRQGCDGWLASTPLEFAQGMLALGRDRLLRQRLGQAARQTALERYSLTRIGRQLQEVLTQVTARAGGRHGA